MAECSHAAGFYHYCAITSTNLHGGTYSPRTLRKTHTFLYFFKKGFSKIFGPFSGAPGLFPTIFEFPYSRYITSNFFRRFNLFSHFLLHNVGPPDDRQSQTGVTNLWAVTYTWPLFFPHNAYSWREEVDTYLHRHPYARTLLVL